MRSFSTLVAFVTLIVTYGIQGTDAGATHDKLNTRASIHRRSNNPRNVNVPPTLKKSKRLCRPRPSPPNNATVVSPPPPPVATGSTTNPPNTGNPNTGSNTPVGNSDYRLDHSHQGASFFDGWNFINVPDYTHGVVNYLNREDATGNGLAYVDNNGRARMKVDTTGTVWGNRPSVRIEDNYKFNQGTILIMDSTHMPTGCATWPAFWTNHGVGWPEGGEIDIIEGVHDQSENLSSLHTTGGCTISDEGSFSGTVGNWDCTSNQGSNQGCNIHNPSSNQPNTYGAGFNSIGGGVYAMQWDERGIRMWFFPRDSIPADITADSPTPDATWGKPYANFPFASCSPDHFYDNIAIFDTTLCGDWAGATWGSECAQKTGYANCHDFVQNRGDAFSEAYWEINYVKYFLKK